MDINKLIEINRDRIIHYGPYFFRNNLNQIFQDLVKDIHDEKSLFQSFFSDQIIIVYEKLSWDTDFFGFPTFRIKCILFENFDFEKISKAIKEFHEGFSKESYIFYDVPSEDILLIQTLNRVGFRLVETRLTYYLDLLKFNNERYEVREAESEDIPHLVDVSISMRNPYDRFHADPKFGNDLADSFLGEFTKQSIAGFADVVIVPNEKNVPPDSFVTGKYQKDLWEELGIKVSKMVLSAVSSKTNKGWYIKLISEMAYKLKDIGAEYAIMTPASTNKAVIHTYEKLGCKLGRVSHILSSPL